MKKLLAVAFLSFALLMTFGVKVSAQNVTPVAQVQRVAAQDLSDEDKAAWEDFVKFAADHKLGAGYRNSTPDTWDLALFTLDENGDYVDIKWAVYGFKSLPAAVKQIESDVTTYPNGHNEEPQQ